MHDGKGGKAGVSHPLFSLPIVPSAFSFSPLPSLPTTQRTPLGKVDTEWLIKAFPSYPGPLYQNEVKCSAFDMEMIFHFHPSKTHFRKNGCALGLILKVKGFGTRRAVAHSHDCEVDFCQLRLIDWKQDRCGAVTQGLGRGLGIPPAYYEHDHRLLIRETKGTS